MKLRVPWLLKTPKHFLLREMVTHYLAYLETRKRYATGETAERTCLLIGKLQTRIRRQFPHL